MSLTASSFSVTTKLNSSSPATIINFVMIMVQKISETRMKNL